MLDNQEIVVKQHDLKLLIQKFIMEDHELLKNTPDIGYTSWLTAERIVNNLVSQKISQRMHRKKNFIDFILPKL